MADNNDSGNVDKRLQNAVYGTPKIKPDEQRHYMGTFRERVWLTISVAESKANDWSDALNKELKAHPDSLVIINGNISDQFIKPYITIANQTNTQFTIKTGADVKTDDDALAVVVCNNEAVFQTPVDVVKKYGTNKTQAAPKKKESLLHRLFHI